LSPDGESENGGPIWNDVCAHRPERGVSRRKNAVELAGPKRIDPQGRGSGIGLTNQMRVRVTSPEAVTEDQSQLHEQPCKRISEEAAKETTKQMAELQKRYRDAFIYDVVDPRVTLCKVMAHSDCRDGFTWTQADSNGRIHGNTLTPTLKGRQIPSTCLLLERGVVLRYQSRENDGTRIATI
jgi:hypothetical protein